MTQERTRLGTARHRPAHAQHAVAEPWWRPTLRFALALAVGGALTDLAWRHIGTHLSVTTDIVGRTTFADFDIYRYLDRFYDIALVFPVLTTLVYLLIARFGTLRASKARRPWPPDLDASDTVVGLVQRHESQVGPDPAVDGTTLGFSSFFWALARMLLPALTVGFEVNATRTVYITRLTRSWIGAGLAYVVVVVVVAVAVCLRRRVRATTGAPHDRVDIGSFLARNLVVDLALMNSAASIVVIPLFVFVSSRTAVTVVTNGHVTHYPWFPLWLGALTTLAVAAALVRALGRARDAGSRLRVERRTLFLVVVPVLVFMISAGVQGAQGPFQAFDDAQAMVGAQLSFGHGLWPWKDLFLLHGFLADDLYGGIGMWVLSPTRWGSNAGLSLLVVPFTLMALYGFIVYFSRKNRLLMFAGTLALVLGLIQGWAITRYMLLPVVLILFDRVLRQGSWARCTLLMASVVFISIVTPEATLIMLGVLATLIAAEVVHRPRREQFRTSFSRTIRCLVTGAGFTLAWVVFLIATDTLSGFIAYYQTTISGHELWGAYSPQWSLTGAPWLTVEFALPVFLFLMTAWRVVGKLRRRTAWRPIEWVIVASSTPVLLFYPVVLDRMDGGHVNEVFQTLIPFVVLWAIEIAGTADTLIVWAGSWLIRRWRATAHLPLRAPVTFLSIFAIAFGSPISIASWKDIPGHFHPLVPANPPSVLPLGYTVPSAIQIPEITDLGKVLDRYAGSNGPVFDFTNEMGITYFLLNRVPGARFYHVESAQTAKAQELEVSDLEHSRPHIVIFNDNTFGLPIYDGIFSMERNYLVSQYILDHYRPLLDTHGQLILLRDDLFSHAQPLPHLSAPPVTSDLYFDLPSCDWGYVPNFLVHPKPEETGGALTLSARRTGTGNFVTVTGWAFDTADGKPAREVLAVSRGKVVGALAPTRSRTDIVSIVNNLAASSSGYQLQFSVARAAPYRIYILNADGSVTPLPPPAGDRASNPVGRSVTTPDGVVHPIRLSALEGSIDSASTIPKTRTFTLSIPAGTDLAAYRWMEMQSGSGFGRSRIEVTDDLAAGPPHLIAFNTLPSVGRSVYTRVGSCLQWHGYHTEQLTLLVHGPSYNFSVRLLK